MIIISKVKFYISGDIVRDIGIVYFSEILRKMGVNITLEQNYLEFQFIEPDIISDYILDNLIFEVFKRGKKDKLQEILNDTEDLNARNFVDKLNEVVGKQNEKVSMIKDFENRRFPYVRNSGKYGLNTSLENMEKNFKSLVNVVLKSNIGVREITLETFKENSAICSVCNINKTTKLDINLNNRVDSKLTFLFKGAEKSGFRNNGQCESNICFECEFLNLMSILYINLERPVALAYTNNLREILFVNYKIMTKRKSCSDKAFYRLLAKEKIMALKIYDFDIDANKGIILRFNSIADYETLVKRIELIDIIDSYNFSRESGTMKKLCKTMVDNESLMSLKEILFSNLMLIKSEGASRDIDKKGSLYNIMSYVKALWIIKGREEYEMDGYKKQNDIYVKVGKNLANKMIEDNKRKNFVFKVVQLLKSNDKSGLFQTIMHTLASYRVSIGDGFVEGIMKSDELQLNTNIGLFIQELMFEGESKK